MLYHNTVRFLSNNTCLKKMTLLTLASTAAQDILLYSHSFKVMTFITYLVFLYNMQVRSLYMSTNQCEQLLYHKHFTLSFYMLSKSKHCSNEKPLLLSSHLVLASQRKKKITSPLSQIWFLVLKYFYRFTTTTSPTSQADCSSPNLNKTKLYPFWKTG